MPPELTVAERPAYLRALNGHALQRVDFHLLNLDHALISSLHPLALDGQVNYNSDGDGTVARTLQAGFLDPDHSLNLDSDAPTDGMGGLHRLLRVRHSVWVDELDKWATTDIFTGQPMVPKRDGDTITLECHDKSARHLRFAPPTTIRKGTPWITAIRQGLRAAGEHHFRFPSATLVGTKVPRNIPVGGADEARQPWKVWKSLARQHGYQLFYDGSGYAVLRKIPAGTPVITWRMEGDEANILGPLSYTADHTKVRNRVVVTSKRTVGRRNVSLSAAAQTPSGLYAPAVLAAGDVPWTNTEYFANNALTRRASLLNVARQRLKTNTTQAVTINLPVMPVFHLDPLDRCRVTTADASVDFALREASVPLFDDGASGMTIGSQKNVRSVASGRIGRLA